MDVPPQFKSPGFSREKLLPLLEQGRLDGILLTSPENVFYTTGYTVLPSSGNPILYSLRNRLPFYVFVDRRGKVSLLCWGFSTFGVEFGADEVIGFENYAGALEALEALLTKQMGPQHTLGIESTCPYYVLALLEEKVKPGGLQVVDGIMAQLRLIKSDAEIDLIQKSTEIIETTLAELYDLAYVGMSRLELMQEGKARLYKNGATGISHLTFTFGHANPEIAIGETLQEGDLVTMDLGGIYQGYTSDNRRYMFAGVPPAALLEHYEAMVRIVDAVGEALVPGTSYAELFKYALDLFEKHAVEPLERFNHVGHNIGLETEEEWLTDDPNLSVRAGMTINIELYSIAATGHFIGDEETYLIDSSGPTRISHLPRQIKLVA